MTIQALYSPGDNILSKPHNVNKIYVLSSRSDNKQCNMYSVLTYKTSIYHNIHDTQILTSIRHEYFQFEDVKETRKTDYECLMFTNQNLIQLEYICHCCSMNKHTRSFSLYPAHW